MNNYCWSPIYTGLPSTGILSNDRYILINYWEKYLIQKAMSVYKWKMPELWSENYFKYSLYVNGFVSVLYTAKYGWIPQKCGLSGFNLFEEPNGIIINNQFVTIERKIGDACVIFRMNPDYTGIVDLIEAYACQLAEMHLTAYANMQSTKVGFILTADNKNMAEDLKKIADQILNGETAVVSKKNPNIQWDYFSNNVKQNYVVSDILVDMRKLLNMFNTEFGIPNANTEKKERMVTDEVNSNNGDTKTRAEMWLNSFKDTCDKLNIMAGELIMSVDWNPVVREAVKADVQTKGNESK